MAITPITDFYPDPELRFTSQGQPYQEDPRTGKRRYLSPLEAAGLIAATKQVTADGGTLASSSHADPRLEAWAGKMGASIGTPGGTLESGKPNDPGLLATDYQWDPNSGQWESHFDWNAALGLGTAGVIAAPGAASAIGAIGGGAAASSSAAAGTGAGTGAAGASSMGWLDPVLKYVLPTAGGIFNTVSQNNANKDAMRMQQEYYQQALKDAQEQREYDRKMEQEKIQRDLENQAYNRKMEQDAIARGLESQGYSRSQYANYLDRLNPFYTAGREQLPTLQMLLNRNPFVKL